MNDVAVRLRRVARREWRRAALAGLGGVLLAAWGTLAVQFAVDYWGTLDLPARVGLNVVTMLVFLAWAARHWRRHIRSARGFGELAVQAEQRFGSLRGVLLSALAWREYLDDGDRGGARNARVRAPDWPTGMSRELAVATCREAAIRSVDVDFRRLGDVALARHARWLLGAGLLAWFLTWVLTPAGMADAWWKRNVLLRDVDWPRATRIEVQGLTDGKLIIPRGGQAELTIRAWDRAGNSPPLDVRLRPRRSHSLVTVGKPPGTGYRFTVRDVIEPFWFRVHSGDARTHWLPVELVEAPRIERLSLVAITPTYLGGERLELAPGQGPYRVPRGSRLLVEGVASKPLKRINARTSAGEFALRVPEAARGESRLGTTFSREFSTEELGDGLLAISVTDIDGLDLSHPLLLRLEWVDDESPAVMCWWRGVSRLLVPRGRVDWSAEFRDDHGVSSVRVLARVTDAEGGEVRPWRELTVTPPVAGLPSRTLDARGALDARELDLAIGMIVTLVTVVEDNDEVTGPKTARSAERVLRVVTEGELREDWQRREREERQQLEQTWLDLREWTETTLSSGNEGESPNVAQGDTWAQTRREYRSLRQAMVERVSPLEEIGEEMRWSGLELAGSPLVERRRLRIMEPLKAIANERMPQVERLLAEMQRDVGGIAALPVDERRRLESEQGEVLSLLRDVLDELARSEGLQEAVRLAEQLIDEQQAVLSQTMEAERRRVQELLDREGRQ